MSAPAPPPKPPVKARKPALPAPEPQSGPPLPPSKPGKQEFVYDIQNGPMPGASAAMRTSYTSVSYGIQPAMVEPSNVPILPPKSAYRMSRPPLPEPQTTMALNANANGGARFNAAAAPVLIRPPEAPPASGAPDLPGRPVVGRGPFLDNRQPQGPIPQMDISFSVNGPNMNSTLASPSQPVEDPSTKGKDDKVKGRRDEEKKKKEEKKKQDKGKLMTYFQPLPLYEFVSLRAIHVLVKCNMLLVF